MIRTLLAGLVALGLSACVTDPPSPATPSSVPASTGPAAFADQTAMDEQTVLAIEAGVEAAADLGTLGIKAGVIKGANIDRVLVAIPKVRSALAVLRAAYKAGNRTSYLAAVGDIRRAVGDIRNLAKGDVR